MLLIILLLGLAVGLTTFFFMLIARYASRVIAVAVEARMRAAETITNEERIPEAWIASYLAKRDELVARGAEPGRMADLGRKAQADCLKKLADLTRFFENDPIVDSTESRLVLHKALQKAKKTWQDAGWEYFLGQHPVGAEPAKRIS